MVDICNVLDPFLMTMKSIALRGPMVLKQRKDYKATSRYTGMLP